MVSVLVGQSLIDEHSPCNLVDSASSHLTSSHHHVEPRVQLFVAQEETFPVPLKYTDVTKVPHKKLDVFCKKAVLTIIGMSMWIEVCPAHGQDSRSSHCCMKTHQLDICGLGGGLQKFKQLPDQISLWPENGPTCQKQLRKSTSKNGLSKNRRSTMLEDRNFYLDDVESSRKQFKTQGKVGDPDGSGYQKVVGNRRRNQRIRQKPKDRVCMRRGGS